MKKAILFCLFLFGFYGCAGVDIKPISGQDAIDIHKSNSVQRGYVVYEQIVVVEVSKKEVCIKEGTGNKCEMKCTAGTPFVLPDYSKPYLINLKSGFGKAGSDVTINDGWRLGNVKDNSDNTAILGNIMTLATKMAIRSPSKDNNKCAEGLYRVHFEESPNAPFSPSLKKLFSY